MVFWSLENSEDEGWENIRLHGVNTDHEVPVELALSYFPTLHSVPARPK